MLGGGIAFGLLYWIYRMKVKRNTLTEKSLYNTLPPVVGVINLLLAAAFTLLFILNPEAFSPEQTISSPVAYALFTVFCTYFYIAALPLSIGYVAMTAILFAKQFLSNRKFIVSTASNSVGALMLAVLIYQVFG